jgi:peroxiredoxin
MRKKKEKKKDLFVVLCVGFLSTIAVCLVVLILGQTKIEQNLNEAKKTGELNIAIDQNQVQVSNSAPDFELRDFNGNRWQLSSFRGQPVVLEFFADWCDECHSELDLAGKMAKEYKDTDLQIIGIHLSNTESLDFGARLAQENNLTFLLLQDETGQVFKLYSNGQRTIPLAIFIDRHGAISEVQSRGQSESNFRDNLEKILK